MPPTNPLTLISMARDSRQKEDRAAVASAVADIVSHISPAVTWVPIADACLELVNWAYKPKIDGPGEPKYEGLVAQTRKFRDECFGYYDRAVEEKVSYLRKNQPTGDALRALASLCVAREQFESRKKIKVTFRIHGGLILKEIKADLDR